MNKIQQHIEQESFARLAQCGVKPSVQRLAIMQYVLSHSTHPSVDDVYNALAGDIPTLSKTTVYNTLQLLEEKGAILMVNIDKRMAHFDGDIVPHGHFICEKCNKIYDIPYNFTVPTDCVDKSFSVREASVYYKGICKDCLTD